jgi:dephospho-CoA kinase
MAIERAVPPTAATDSQLFFADSKVGNPFFPSDERELRCAGNVPCDAGHCAPYGGNRGMTRVSTRVFPWPTRVGENILFKRDGLTGGVASGKSTVSRLLRELGAVVVDADALAREVVEPQTAGLAAVVEEFGPDVLGHDGALDRAKLGAIVFADAARRRALEAVIHPLVRARAAEIESRAAADAIVVHDIPLLVETGQADAFDAVVVVDVPEELQVARAVDDRGWSEEEAWSRVRAQASREQRLAAATYVVDNSGTHEDLRQRVAEVFEELRRADPPG